MKIVSKRGKKVDVDLSRDGSWPFPANQPDPLTPEDEEVLRRTASGLDWDEDWPGTNYIQTGDDDETEYAFSKSPTCRGDGQN